MQRLRSRSKDFAILEIITVTDHIPPWCKIPESGSAIPGADRVAPGVYRMHPKPFKIKQNAPGRQSLPRIVWRPAPCLGRTLRIIRSRIIYPFGARSGAPRNLRNITVTDYTSYPINRGGLYCHNACMHYGYNYANNVHGALWA